MRKRYQRFSKENFKTEVKSSEEPVKTSLKTKKRIKIRGKHFILIAAFIVLAVLCYVGIGSIGAANNILAQDISFSSLFRQNSLKQTDGITNVLLLGKGGSNHPGGQLTDTIMLARIRSSDKKIALVSVPRDLLVTIPGNGQVRVNEAYALAFNEEKDQDKKSDAGAKATSVVIEKTLAVPVHYYTVVDFLGFKDLVDALGGITINVEKALDDPYYPRDYFTDNGYVKTDAYAPLHIKAGIQAMDGETALKYSRSRETTSDFDRAARQQKILFAIKEKALSIGVLSNPVKMNNIFASLGIHIRTSFNASELKDLLGIFESISKDKIVNKVLDNSEEGLLESSSEGFYHLVPKSGNFQQVQKAVKNVFDDEEAVLAMVDVEVYNGTSTVGLAGKLADTLKEEGFNVTKIENADKMFENTTIYDGTNSSKTYQKIKGLVGTATRSSLDEKGTIKIYIGSDYGN